MASLIVLVCRRPGSLGEAEPAFSEHALDSADDGYRAIELAQRSTPAAIVVELAAAAMAPLELIRRLHDAAPAAKIVFVVPEGDIEAGADVLRAGGDGILAGEPSAAELRWAVGSASADGTPIAPTIARGLAQRFADIVGREQQWSRSIADISRQAESLAATKAEFLSNVSHELRTPLTIIKGVAQVVGRFGSADEQQTAMLSQLEEAATKLTRMVENLLVLAEMERGEFRLDIDECDVAELVRDGATDAAARYPEVTLDLRVPASLPGKADAERMREVVRHLVDNACRYSEEGDTVTVQAKKAEEGITVAVTDQGSGVDRAVVRAAFGEAFTTGEKTLTKERAGLGLGLNLARSIIAMHGGILSADPLPGGGSRLAFVLPPEPADQPQRAPAAAADAGAEGDQDDPLAMLRELQRKLSDSETRAQ